MTTKTIKRAASADQLAVKGIMLRQLMAEPYEEPGFIIKPWFRERDSLLLWAAAGVGKTMLSLTLALVVAGGGSVAGWSNETPRKVLIVDGEMPLGAIQSRLGMLKDAVEGIDWEAAQDNIEIHARQRQDIDGRFYDLSQGESHQAILRTVKEKRIDLLILDNVTTLTDAMGDENSVESTKPVLKFLMDLKKTNVAVIVVHHANKTGQGFRGSSALETTVEMTMGLTRPDNTEMGSAAFRVEFGKYRHRRDATLAPQVLTLTEFGWSSSATCDDAQRIVDAIKSCEFVTQGDAGRSLGFKPDKTSKLLKKALSDGRITEGQIKICLIAAAKNVSEDTVGKTLS